MSTKVTHETGKKMEESYGAWTEIFSFLMPQQILSLQALSRFMYRLGVSRCQETFHLVPHDFFYRQFIEKDSIRGFKRPKTSRSHNLER